MANTPPSNVRIYDRPERRGKALGFIALIVILVLAGYLLYRFVWSPRPTASGTQPGFITGHTAFQQETLRNGLAFTSSRHQ